MCTALNRHGLGRRGLDLLLRHTASTGRLVRSIILARRHADPNDDFDPHQELNFATGLGGAEISIETFSGNIQLQKGG